MPRVAILLLVSFAAFHSPEFTSAEEIAPVTSADLLAEGPVAVKAKIYSRLTNDTKEQKWDLWYQTKDRVYYRYEEVKGTQTRPAMNGEVVEIETLDGKSKWHFDRQKKCFDGPVKPIEV